MGRMGRMGGIMDGHKREGGPGNCLLLICVLGFSARKSLDTASVIEPSEFSVCSVCNPSATPSHVHAKI